MVLLLFVGNMVGKLRYIFFLFISLIILSCNDNIKYYGINEPFNFEGGKIVLTDFEIASYDELENERLLLLNYKFTGFSNAFHFANDDFKIDETIQYSSEKYNTLINGYDIIYRESSTKPEEYKELNENNSFEYKITFIISLKNREKKTWKHNYYIGHFFNLYSKLTKENIETKYPEIE